MSTTIYDSPEDRDPTLPGQGALYIDITHATVWFFEDRADETRAATVPLIELEAIYKAIGDYLEASGPLRTTS